MTENQTSQSNHQENRHQFEWHIPWTFFWFGGSLGGLLLGISNHIFGNARFHTTILVISFAICGCIPAFITGLMIALCKLKRGIWGYLLSGCFGGLNMIWFTTLFQMVKNDIYLFVVLGFIVAFLLSLLVLTQKQA